VLGPAAVVVYACTTKILALVMNQPYLIATTALPAVTEIQATGERDRLWRACRALGLGILLVSGGLAVAVLAVNGAFVPWWVGPEQYGGPTLTLLAVVAMIARHWTFTLLQTVFALGHDRRLAVTALADGLVTVASMVGWVAAVGVIGLPLGSLTGLVLTNGPVAVLTLAAEEGVSPLRVLRGAVPWLVRFLAVGGPVAAASFSPHASDPVFAAGLLAAGVIGYVVLCLPLLGREPLRGYREQAIATLRRKLGFRAPT
jgi:O-antigen/teichoic acid export membrane protein